MAANIIIYGSLPNDNFIKAEYGSKISKILIV